MLGWTVLGGFGLLLVEVFEPELVDFFVDELLVFFAADPDELLVDEVVCLAWVFWSCDFCQAA